MKQKLLVMKRIKLIGLFALVFSASLCTSCKKDYSCTCTTTVGGLSTTKVYDLRNQRINDANQACDRYETDLNNGAPGTTTCHL